MDTGTNEDAPPLDKLALANVGTSLEQAHGVVPVRKVCPRVVPLFVEPIVSNEKMKNGWRKEQLQA